MWIHGKSGTGKTRYVYEKEAHADIWESGTDLKWWQGYEHQDVTLFDDFRGDQCKFHWLLRLIDRYPVTVEVKGGSRQLIAQRMYITSAYPPGEIYQKSAEDQYQLRRRIDEVIDMDQRAAREVGEIDNDIFSDLFAAPLPSSSSVPSFVL